MAGFIGQWGPRQEQLHPRGFHGRWTRKFNIPQLLPRVLAKMDQIFHPRTFQSDSQAGQYLHNKAHPTRFKNGTDYRRMMVDWDEANAGLQSGTITPSTQRYIDMMEENKVTLEDDLILTQVFTPEALGFTPQQMAEQHGDFDGLLGAVVADKGYSATHIGSSPQMGPGKIQMAIAAPKGTQVIIPSRAHNDPAVFLDRDQNLLITRVDRNPTTGEYYVMAVVMPKQKNEPNVPNLEAPRGAGFTDQQREARIGQPVAPNDQAARAGQRPPMGAGGQVTQEDVAPQAESPPVQAPPQAAPQPAPAPSSPVQGQGQGPAPRNEPIHRQSVGGTGGAEGRAPEEIATAPPEAAPEAPAPQAPAAPPSPQQEHLDRARQRAEAKRGYRQMASAIPVADALQTVEELRHQKQDPKVIAQHIRGITTDPSMDEVPADRRQALADKLNGAADLFEQGKTNQGAARLSSAAREMDLETGDKPGSTVDYDPATMESVSDVADGQQVEVLRPPVTHVDPDTGKSTVVSKGRVRPVGGAPEAVPTGIAEAPAAPEVPAAPVKAAKKAAGSKFTPEQEDRLVERAKLWRGQERNDEERRIVGLADKILARDKKKAEPGPVREPRQGRAPMAKKAAAKAAPAPAKKAAAPEKKAAPKKLTPERDPYTHTGANIIKDANEKLANGRDPEQVAEEMREDAEALFEHGEPLHTDDLVNPGRTEHSDDDLRDIARGDSSLIHRMADDLEKQSATPAPAKKAAPEKKAAVKKAAPAKLTPEQEREFTDLSTQEQRSYRAFRRTGSSHDEALQNARDTVGTRNARAAERANKKAPDLLAEQEAKKLERAKAQHAKDEAAKAKAAERTRVAEEKKAATAKAKEERAAAKAQPVKKTAVPKADKELTPEQRAIAEVQARADEAGLPTKVADLRAAAKEQGIRGFSTMRKEQLQRALLGEEVSTGTTKLQVVSPEKMVGHLERVDSDSAARTLLEKHTLKDLKALADQVGIDHKERKLTTKDKLKTAILHEVRGAPGTDFEPVSPDEAVSIRDIKVPDGPDGDMLRRGLVEVDDTDPASLRDESERLESHATQLRQNGDRVNAALYQDASDRMGMRAQQISGMEEVPKPTKRAPRKAAVPRKRTEAEIRTLIGPKLTDELLQAAGDHERQRKDAQRLMEGLAKANPDSGIGRAAKKAAQDLQAPGTEPDLLTRLQSHDNPLSREEAEGVLGKLKRAELLDMARQLSVPGAARRTMPELRREIYDATSGRRSASIATRGFHGERPDAGPISGGLEPGPAADRVLRIEHQRSRGTAFAHIHQVMADGGSERALESIINTRARQNGLSDGERDGLIKALRQGKLSEEIERLAAASGLEQMHTTNDVIPYDPEQHRGIGGNLRRGTPVSVVRPGYRDTLHGEGVIVNPDVMKATKEEADKFRAAETRAKKAVAPGSVPGPRTQARVTNNERAAAFDQAWEKAGIPDSPGRSASRTLSEIRADIREGRLSPEEGIRRLETDIDFNKSDVAEIEAVLRDEQLDPVERKELEDKLFTLHADIVHQEKASKFMRRYFRKEPEVTPAEAKAALDPEQQSWLDNASPDEIREGARLQGLGEIKGDTAEEVWDNAVKAVVEREIASREAKKAKAAKAAAKKALPPAAPKVDPDDPERLDVRRIGHGIDFKEEDQKFLDTIQARLDGGEDPAKIAETFDSPLSPRAQNQIFADLTDMEVRINDAHNQGMSPDYIRGLEQEEKRLRANFERMEAQAKRQEELGRRLQAMKRPAKKAAPTIPAPVKAGKELPPLANGTRRKSMTNVEVGDLIRAASGAQGERAVPKRVTSVERTGSRIIITREDGSRISGAPQTAVWLGEASAPAAPAPTKARRVGPGGSSFPADMPAEERARRVAEIEKRQAKKAAPNPNLDGLSDDELRKILASDQFPDAQKDRIRSELTAREAKKETAQVQARLLTTAMERVEAARTEAQVREAVKGLTMSELKTVAGKYPLGNVGRSKESITKALVDFHTNKGAPSLPEGQPIKKKFGMQAGPDMAERVGRTAGDAPLHLPNRGADQGLVHFDSQLGQLWLDLISDDREPNSFVNNIAKIGEQVGLGHMSLDDAADELRVLQLKAKDQAVVKRIQEAIDGITTSAPLPDMSLPEGTPDEIRSWLHKLSQIPTLRKTDLPGNRRKKSVLDEALEIVRHISTAERDWRSGEMESKLAHLTDNIHESIDGVYAARRISGQTWVSPSAEIRAWLRGKPTS